MPALLRAQSARMALSASTRMIDVRRKAANVWVRLDGKGRSGLVLDPGQASAVDLTNALDAPTIIQWQGQIPRKVRDDVRNLPMPMLQPGEARAHVPEHEMLLLAAPLIVRRPEDQAADRREATLFLHGFSFSPPAEVLAGITGGASMAAMDHRQMGHGRDGHAQNVHGRHGDGSARLGL